jgi:hypothetical protein
MGGECSPPACVASRLQRFVAKGVSMKKLPLLLPLLLGALLVAAVAASPPEGSLEHTDLLATVVNFGALSPHATTETLRIQIREISPQSEADRLGDVLNREGQTGLEKALEHRDVGFVQFGQRLPEPLAAAFVTDFDNGRHVMLVSERPLGLREVWGGLRSESYRFRMIELDLDDNNHGSGSMLPAARFSVNDGQVIAENYGVWPWRLLNVRPANG